jgi:hypothetical protein
VAAQVVRRVFIAFPFVREFIAIILQTRDIRANNNE